jgi:UDP-N-acetylmuramoyl-tripeptide--D-alanyl-D-alanine ligase
MNIESLYNIYKVCSGITTDSRNVGVGALFFALRGDSFDGNRFAAAALDKGAACAVVDDERVAVEYAATHPEADISKLFFLTDNVLETLQALAAHHRRTLGIPILAITGTNGKTTTKELVTAVLSRKYNVYSTRGNLNNHIGVPLTLLAMTEETRFGVVEMGASAQGEIKLLCDIAMPDYGLITNIGRAHLEGFGGEEGVRKGKGELYDCLAATGGKAVVRRDDAVLTAMAEQRPELNVEWYDINCAEGMDSRLAGDYNRANVAAAVAVGQLFGIPDTDIKEAIRDYEPTNNRSQIINTGRNVVLADCYNANPSSMAAAIANFAGGEVNADYAVRYRTAILGDMMELGEWSAEEHKRIAKLVIAGGLNRVIFTGANFADAVRGLYGTENIPIYIKLLPDTARLKEYLGELRLRDNIILIKGSRSMKLEEAIGLL